MKRRWADRRDWSWLTDRTFSVVRVDCETFSGYRTSLLLRQMSRPIWVDFSDVRYCVADSGYLWLQYFPDGMGHALTAMFDLNGNIVQWYLDICAGWGVAGDGVPWFNDMYLDIAVLPSRETLLLDEDELEAALAADDISRADYDLAWSEARRVMQLIEEGCFPLIAQSLSDVVEMRSTFLLQGTDS